MIQRLLAGWKGLRRSRRALAVAGLSVALAALWLGPVSAAQQGQVREAAAQAADQVLTWTADDSMTEYASAPATATAGPATIVFENSEATGNTTFMTHTLTFDTSTPGYNHDVNLNITASPLDSNGGRHEAQVTLTPGKYRYFCAIPGHGQMVGELVVTDGGSQDTTPPEVTPEITGDQDAEGNFIGSATITLNATDTGSGVDTIEYEIDDTGFQPYTGPVTVDRIGDHTVQYRATDLAGNTSETGSTPFRVVEPTPDDTTPPEVTAQVSGDQNDEGGYIGSATVTLNATDAGSGVAGIEYNLDGAGYQPYTAAVQVSEVGEHTVTYRATDNSGNTSPEGSTTFTVVEPAGDDTTPPEVTAEVTGDQDESGNYVGSASVTLAATDADSGVASVEYNLDGAGYEPYTQPVTIEGAGDHTLTYRATDNSGNTSQEGSVIVTIVDADPQDTTPPEVSADVAGDKDDQGRYVGKATVTLTATDTGSGVDTVSYALDDGSYGPYTSPVEVTEPGEHTLRFRATDNAGNTSEIKSVSFTVVEADQGDKEPPQVSVQLVGPQDAHWNYVGMATVSLSATDAGSGVRFVRYSLDGGSYTAYNEPVVITAPGKHTVLYHAVDHEGNRSEDGKLTFNLVAEEGDQCVASDVRRTVVIDGHDSTVLNVDTGNGCTINDLINEKGEYASHNAFVKHVQDVTGDLRRDGVITAKERDRIVKAAKASDIGR
ncbi:OmpL47-type beta-barrel domain-containing protein [Prauserella muralis]|uniref:Uncharacterized protein n=1 Tax=Prauserella muralis TaxID=588067 RepID=A0A2V4B1V0_9PSEU|nr:chitobiase/beta-hexosaminidase C-terminal domain-containing protein [Prauserella muralis]PXY27348.1 hypothetical protein BAY60_12965 [Prauserella muralis]TWE22968.1 Ig-like protein group 3 [Prauserella muralis]